MEAKTLKVCLMMDCTASMTPWLAAAKERILTCLKTVKSDYPEYEIYVAFIGYRDYNDIEKIVFVDFTTDHMKVKNRISIVQAEGGDDAAEDVSGAYRLAASLDWNANVKLLFHICDAPAHGISYHVPDYGDDHPEDDYKNPLEPHVERLALKNIDITVIELNETTRIMVDVMHETYRRVRPIGGFGSDSVSRQDSQNPTNYFQRMFSSRMTRSIMRSQDPDTLS
jgi:hypothetical protein